MGKNTKLTLTINLVLFLLVFVLHALRLIFGVNAQFGSWNVPLWLSIIALAVSGLMIYLNYKAL